jgi:hypothetical protein
MDEIGEIRCRGCGGQLRPLDEVRAVYRELTDPRGGHPSGEPRWGYTHLGHEPGGTAYRITGRGRLLELEEQRQELRRRFSRERRSSPRQPRDVR